MALAPAGPAVPLHQVTNKFSCTIDGLKLF